MVDGEEGTTKHTQGATEEKIGINRRRSQMDAEISSADSGGGNRLALRATEKNYPTGFTGLCRISFCRKALMKNM